MKQDKKYIPTWKKFGLPDGIQELETQKEEKRKGEIRHKYCFVCNKRTQHSVTAKLEWSDKPVYGDSYNMKSFWYECLECGLGAKK